MTRPTIGYDRIRLFPSLEAVQALLPAGDSAQVVAVDYDPRMKRVIPLWTDPTRFDPGWTTPAQPHPDGSITAKGPIPEDLFIA